MIGIVRRLGASSDETNSASLAAEIAKMCDGDATQRDLLREFGGIEHLVARATGKSRASAIQALSAAARNNEENKIAIAQKGGVEALVKAVEEDAKEAGAECLSILSTNGRNKVLVASAGGLEVLTKALDEKNEKIQRFAVAALRNLSANNSQNKASIIVGRATKPIIRLLDSANDAIAEEAAATLANLARTTNLTDHYGRIQHVGDSVGSLVNNLTSRKSKHCVAHNAGALAVFAAFDGFRATIVRAGGAARLAKLVVDCPKCCQAEVTCALQNLTSARRGGRDGPPVEACTAIVEKTPGALSALVGLLLDGSETTKASAAATLRNVTFLLEDSGTRAVVEAEAIPFLAQFFAGSHQSPPSRSTTHAMALLRNISYNSEHRELVGKEPGLIRSLMTTLDNVRYNCQDATLTELTLATVANVVAGSLENQRVFRDEVPQGHRALKIIANDKNTTTAMQREHAQGAMKNLLRGRKKGTSPSAPPPREYWKENSGGDLLLHYSGPSGDGLHTSHTSSLDIDQDISLL